MPWLVFAAAFALYSVGASPALGWYDAPEFIAASVGLGIPHSPGHPLPVMAGVAGTMLPIGDLTLRVNLLSSLAAAGACAALAVCGRSLLAVIAAELPSRARSTLAAAAALMLAGSHALWAQAVRAEVYALCAALVIGLLAAVLAWNRDGRARWLVLAGLLGGLGLATHHLVAMLALIPAGAFVLVRPRPERPSPAVGAVTALAGIIGLAAFLYLPVRSSADPALDWGAPRTAASFAWTVSGAMFADNAGGGHASPPLVDAVQTIHAVGEAAGAPLALLGMLGAAALLARPGRRRLGLFLIGVLLTGAAGRALFGFDPDTPDDHGYLVAAGAALGLLGVAGLAAISVAAARHRSAAALALGGALLLLAGGRAVRAWSDESARAARSSDDLARQELEQLPPRALLVASYYQTEFRALALQAVEGTRPDVTVLQRGLLTLPGARDAAARRHPELAALLAAPLATDAPTPLVELAPVAAGRSVFFELDPSLDPPAQPHLVSLGRFARFLSAPPLDGERGVAEEADRGPARAALQRLRAGAAASDTVPLSRVLVWLDFARLDHYCRLGRRSAAQEALDGAWELFPEDVMLEDVAARCGLAVPASPP